MLTKKADANTKLVLIGESSVGKSSITMRITSNKYTDSTIPTIGSAFLMKHLKIGDKTIKIDVWDTAGQERFNSLVPLYYRNANVALVVFDVNSLDSFIKAKKWVQELEVQGPRSIMIILVGNKIDIDDNRRQVSSWDIKTYVNEKNFMYREVSARTGEGIDEMMEDIGHKVLDPSFSKPDTSIGFNSYNTSLLGGIGQPIIPEESAKRWYFCYYL
jgi:small GTP-binding protein